MQNLELSLFLAAAFLATAVLMLVERRLGKLFLVFLAIPLFCFGGAVLWRPPDEQQQLLEQEVPHIGQAKFVGSEVCRSCHISHYESWHRSYHRTMTQLASDQSILAPFDGRVLRGHGLNCTVQRVDDWYVVDMPDPDWEAAEFKEGIAEEQEAYSPQIRLPIVMTTGSHFLQTYWVPSQHGNKVRIFPWVYHIGLQRWIPNRDSFIVPGDSKRHTQVWNNSCILCHSVAGDVGHDPGDWKTRVAELGISCEACHGPGEVHIQRHSNPIERYSQHLTTNADPTIVNPARLSHEKASQVCGQCHTGFDEEASVPFNKYRAGGDYHSIFSLADPMNPSDARFWPDGTMRVGGREFSGMIESACYKDGELSCLSCHSMHESDPNKQLGQGMESDQACIQCHDMGTSEITQHTHHPADSSGSRCYNCHMPYTGYALFNAVRSHRIDAPSATVSVNTGRPNACNQCHLDQTLAWTSDHLHRWYGIDEADLNEDQERIAASLLWLLKGDAVQRVLAAWSLAWKPAVEASGDRWQQPFLAQLLDDPYAVARYMAADSLQKLGKQLGDFDFTVSPDKRSPMALGLQQAFKLDAFKLEGGEVGSGVAPFIDAGGQLDFELLRGLLQQRDDRTIILTE